MCSLPKCLCQWKCLNGFPKFFISSSKCQVVPINQRLALQGIRCCTASSCLCQNTMQLLVFLSKFCFRLSVQGYRQETQGRQGSPAACPVGSSSGYREQGQSSSWLLIYGQEDQVNIDFPSLLWAQLGISELLWPIYVELSLDQILLQRYWPCLLSKRKWALGRQSWDY